MWYELQRADVLARTGFVDDLYQEYPGTDLEALAPRSADVRFPAAWLALCSEIGPQPIEGLLAVPGAVVYAPPVPGRRYLVGADPAEGNPQSDESAATVVDEDGVEQASVAGRFDPSVFAGYLASLAGFYNGAQILVERNNHGHAVLLALGDAWGVRLIRGLDDKAGWLTTAKSKVLAFDAAAERFMVGDCVVRSAETLRQLQAVRGSDLQAPEGQHDDRAMSFVLALAALKYAPPATCESVVIPAVDVIAEADRGGF